MLSCKTLQLDEKLRSPQLHLKQLKAKPALTLRTKPQWRSKSQRDNLKFSFEYKRLANSNSSPCVLINANSVPRTSVNKSLFLKQKPVNNNTAAQASLIVSHREMNNPSVRPKRYSYSADSKNRRIAAKNRNLQRNCPSPCPNFTQFSPKLEAKETRSEFENGVDSPEILHKPIIYGKIPSLKDEDNNSNTDQECQLFHSYSSLFRTQKEKLQVGKNIPLLESSILKNGNNSCEVTAIKKRPSSVTKKSWAKRKRKSNKASEVNILVDALHISKQQLLENRHGKRHDISVQRAGFLDNQSTSAFPVLSGENIDEFEMHSNQKSVFIEQQVFHQKKNVNSHTHAGVDNS